MLILCIMGGNSFLLIIKQLYFKSQKKALFLK